MSQGCSFRSGAAFGRNGALILRASWACSAGALAQDRGHRLRFRPHLDGPGRGRRRGLSQAGQAARRVADRVAGRWIHRRGAVQTSTAHHLPPTAVILTSRRNTTRPCLRPHANFLARFDDDHPTACTILPRPFADIRQGSRGAALGRRAPRTCGLRVRALRLSFASLSCCSGDLWLPALPLCLAFAKSSALALEL